MPKITKAIVAVAGSGTRFLPATKCLPKEMLPILDKPTIQYVVEELAAAGITDIILVTRADKKPLEDHFDRHPALEAELEKNGKTAYRDAIIKVATLANFAFVRQKGPYGNGTPLLSAADWVKDEPFLYCFGDDLVKSKVPFAKQLVDAYAQVNAPLIGVQAVPRDQISRYGIVIPKAGTDSNADPLAISGIIEKPSPEEAPTDLADFGRMVLDQNVIDALRATALGKGNELWIVDAITRYIEAGGDFYAKRVEDGQWLTTGDPANFLAATLKYAADRPELAAVIKDFAAKHQSSTGLQSGSRML